MARRRERSILRLPDPVRAQLLQARIFGDLLKGTAAARIGVCACHEGAGATTVALNLAVMLAERSGEEVALVDANLRSPGLSAGIQSAGFGEFAEGKISPERAFVELAPGVALLPAGRSADPLAAARTGAARLPLLSLQRRLLILDLPPVLDYPEAAILAQGTDGVLLVLAAEETRRPVAREASQRLGAAGVKVIGAVLNRKPHYVPDWLYRML